MQAKVPQRIDMEDRVIGPLTLQQFFYILFGVLIVYLLNSWTSDSPLRILFYPIALVVLTLSISLAFIKIQERPFIYFLGSLIRYIQRPRQRIWFKGTTPSLTKVVNKVVVADSNEVHKDLNRQRVSDVVKVVDTNQ